ncbi:S1C family serine protease [Roseimaritima ulvae]|uniref:Serine protease HtrA n=1 Tax=Roseimaritima ulvae TaxID=980254 RepID=A0A5B9R0R0_9BACT|nr:trypsin-like peptidase domain-containing protein [Roseimaritima ulvae]QEG43006.1 Putative serine protease HtrA [Roseimaritima ulvae]
MIPHDEFSAEPLSPHDPSDGPRNESQNPSTAIGGPSDESGQFVLLEPLSGTDQPPRLGSPPQETREPLVTSPRRTQASGALSQSVLFLLTVALLFAAARFMVPTVVEEVRYAWHRGELRAEYETSGEGLKNASLDSISQAYEMVTQRVGPSVVHIDVQRDLTPQQVDLANFLQERGGFAPEDSADQGSGVIVDTEGYVLTNEHVIAGGTSIQVGLSDGRRVPATVVGVDPLTDLAVLKINADRLIPIAFGESDKTRVGSPVWAVGSPFGLDRTVTFGILSGKHRVVKASTRYQDFMQSDVAVNPGNSGGPLVDARGQLIGINTAIVGDTYRGVSFSIPSNVAKRVYERLRETGRVERGWLGVALSEVPDELHIGENARVRGAYVTGLADSDSPAARAGILAGDIIVQIDQTVLTDMGHLMRKVGDVRVGEAVKLQVRRDGVLKTLVVAIGTRPEDLAMR